MTKFRTPITVNFEGRYVPPGTMIDLPAVDANDFIARFGEYEGPAIVGDQAPAIGALDAASIDALNLHNAINSRAAGVSLSSVSTGAAPAAASTEPPFIDGEKDLEDMSKPELLAEAERLGVPDVKPGDKKADIMFAIEAFIEEQKTDKTA